MWMWMLWMALCSAFAAEQVDELAPWSAPVEQPAEAPEPPAQPAPSSRMALQRMRGASGLLWAGAGVSLGAFAMAYVGGMLGASFGLLGQPTPMYVALGVAAVMGIAGPVMVFAAGEQAAAVSPAIARKYATLRYTSLGLLGGAALLAYLGYTQLATALAVGAETPLVVGILSTTGAVLAFGACVGTGITGSALSVYKAKRAHRRAIVVVAPSVLRGGGGLMLAGAF